jgi:transposase-like protein
MRARNRSGSISAFAARRRCTLRRSTFSSHLGGRLTRWAKNSWRVRIVLMLRLSRRVKMHRWMGATYVPRSAG